MVRRSELQGAAYRSSLTLIYLIFLGYQGRPVLGTVTLSPMTVAPVCHVGDSLQLTCIAYLEFIRWSIMVVNEQGMNNEITVSRNSRDSSPPERQRIINSTTFTFSRTSTEGVLPLISTLSIDSVSISLNGTVVRCMNASDPMTSASTTIQIVDNGSNLYTPKLEIMSEEFGADNVTVTVGWAQQAAVTYTARISPLAPTLSTGNNSEQLILSYNTEYNFSVNATAPCRPNATALIRFSYANCRDPEFLSPTANDSESVPNIEGYDHDSLPTEGTMITFSCPPGFMLIGPNSATCTENGEWEPNLAGVICDNTTDTNVPILSGDSVILIGSISAVIILCIVITAILVAVVVYRKGLTEKRSSPTECTGGGKSNAKHSSIHKVVYKKKSSLWIDNHNQSPQEDLVYADVTVATKNKKTTMVPTSPTVSTTQPELNVEYSAINFKLCNKKPTMEQRPSHDDNLQVNVTLDKLLVLLREQVGPRWYDFGEAVGIDDVVLDSIAKTTFPENCFVEVLDYWLKYFDDGTLSWGDVATALRDINLHELAYHIEQVYTVEADTTNLQESVPSLVTPSSQVLS